ncbi:MAG: hypothetical protein HQ591_05095 [candidate division Zixibacteria bacterium]|nr:hypothetical protein [Candidatus Tariuqbacter arcticus]
MDTLPPYGVIRNIFTLRNFAAAKILLLIIDAPEGKLLTTPGLLCRLVGFSIRTIWNGIDELVKSDLITCRREGSALFLRLQDGLDDDDEEEDVYNMRRIVPKCRDFQQDFTDSSNSSTNRAESSPNREIPAVNHDYHDDDNISSSSSDDDHDDGENNRRNSAIFHRNQGSDAVSQIIESTLNELGMSGEFVFQQLREAAEGLPAKVVTKTMARCIMRQPGAPSYLVAALENAHRDLCARSENEMLEDERLRMEITLGEKLLAGKSIKFEALDQ